MPRPGPRSGLILLVATLSVAAVVLTGCGQYSVLAGEATGAPDPSGRTPTATAVPTPPGRVTTPSAPPSPTAAPTPTAPPSSGAPRTDAAPPTDARPEPIVYAWKLPPDDSSVAVNDDSAYHGLEHRCDGADSLLGDPSAWIGFSSPRAMVIVAAGAATCRGDVGFARALIERSASKWGTEGGGLPGVTCKLYRAIISVLDQVPPEPERAPCPTAGPREFTVFTDADGVDHIDNPVTFDEDESVPSSTPDSPPLASSTPLPPAETTTPQTTLEGVAP